ncbi:hypothetical protein ASE41_30310 [Streptomyces sp. Root264]|nr:hypothetical protein ASE41_30310 [Streptomyces sp. Root264]
MRMLAVHLLQNVLQRDPPDELGWAVAAHPGVREGVSIVLLGFGRGSEHGCHVEARGDHMSIAWM